MTAVTRATRSRSCLWAPSTPMEAPLLRFLFQRDRTPRYRSNLNDSGSCVAPTSRRLCSCTTPRFGWRSRVRCRRAEASPAR